MGRGKLHERVSAARLLDVDFQHHVDLGPVIKLAEGFRVALAGFELGIYLVVDCVGQRRKTIGAVLTDDVSLDGARPGVGGPFGGDH